MMTDHSPSMSPATITGTAALVLAGVLFPVSPVLTVVVLALFLLLCFSAPFFPALPFYLPIISRGNKKATGVALTFDDGPTPISTPILLGLLKKHGLPATFFVTGRQAKAYPELIIAILAHGHTIGNHSWRHDNFLMFRTTVRLREDIHATQQVLLQHGIRPYLFRPPAGITGPRLHRVLTEEKLLLVNYSCRAFDRGNRNIVRLAEKILTRLRPGAIIMLHDLPPYHGEELNQWRQELDRLFTGLREHSTVIPLKEIIGTPVMNDRREEDRIPGQQ